MGQVSRFCVFIIVKLIFFPIILSGQEVADGYRGIWFTLGQYSTHGDKYSGGLGTYTANHVPTAMYSKQAKKTFFVYGGASTVYRNSLQIMISYYDHRTGTVPKPIIVLEKKGVNDPHDNPSLSIDEQGYIWVFVSGRNTSRPGFVYRSNQPYDITRFEKILEDEITYPQPWYIPEKGFLHLFTRYTNGRELYWSASKDGFSWSRGKKIAGFGGHYQISVVHHEKVYTVFNYHPGGNVDKRTNIYLMQTDDLGKSWQNIENKTLPIPLDKVMNAALVHEYEKEGKLVYLQDINIDENGYPVILALISRDHRPGPNGNPREWIIWKRKNGSWNETKVTESTHNYDMGSLYIEKKKWTIIGPTEPGPQYWGTGGEMVLWESRDSGETWQKTKSLTANSQFNHSYARRPLNANKDFYAFWADGHADTLSPSRLYFVNKKGAVRQLPYQMVSEKVKPQKLIAR
jgi:hypothetical protein